jgi:glycosyltransferase involved in cell wall biosynthesis
MTAEMHHKENRVIAIFAHNETRNIISCLNSVKQAMRDGDECYVLNNGSTDDTGAKVDEFSKENSFCKLITIELGDKANAWNVFCHELNITSSVYIFLDGDCTVSPNSFDALESCIKNKPCVNAAAGLPAEHISKKNRAEMLLNGGLAGNLYALSGDFMHRLRHNKVRLPLGLIGDDSLVGALAYWDLDPKTSWDKSRIISCEGANFLYVRLSLFSITDIRLYWRRKIRYSLRYYQIMLMKAPLKSLGLKAIPVNIEEIYENSIPKLKLYWRGLDTWFDYLALKRIRKSIA